MASLAYLQRSLETLRRYRQANLVIRYSGARSFSNFVSCAPKTKRYYTSGGLHQLATSLEWGLEHPLPIEFNLCFPYFIRPCAPKKKNRFAYGATWSFIVVAWPFQGRRFEDQILALTEMAWS